tara:strand:+ start:1451 stop:3967 length:2517 start_codon:yes stop_codon:yes gene_type:complete
MEGTMLNTSTLKTANLGGGGGETEFEQAFSSLAYAYLRDKAPRLLDHMVGFQLVDRNDDNTKAIGVFGFQLDNQWLYAPVFFLNGDLKGHELLYMKNNDSFVPLQENWINYIMSRKPHVLGEAASADNLEELGGLYPDIRSLSTSPSVGGGKRASDSSWVKDVLPMLAACSVKSASSLYRGAGSRKLNQDAIVNEPASAALAKQAQILDFNQVMPTSFALLKTAHAISEDYPHIKRAMQKFYGVDCFSRWGAELRQGASDAGSNLVPTKQAADKPYMPGNLLIPAERPAGPIDHEKTGKLRMYVYEQVIVNKAPELDDAEREKLQNDTILIKDHRDGEEVSKAYNTQVEAKLTNPSETALYRVLERPGKFTKMLIAMNGVSNRGAIPMATVVRIEDSGDKAWLNTHPTQVFADQVSEREEWDEWFDELGDSDSLSEGGEYIAINERGSCSTPFRVRDSHGEGRYQVDFMINIDWNHTRPVTMPRIDNNNFGQYGDDAAHTPSAYGAMLYVDKEGPEGKKIRAIGGELRIPHTFKFLKLSAPEDGVGGSLMSMCCADRSATPPINLGKIDDIQLLFTEKTARLKVFNNGTDVHITTPLSTERMSKMAGLISLVRDHGFREKVAREILQVSEQKGHGIWRVSYAPGYGTEKTSAPNNSTLAGGPGAPLEMGWADERSVEQYGPRTSVQTQYGGDSAYQVDGMSSGKTDPGVWDNWQNYSREDIGQTMQTAQQAGQNGQKEVFDTAMISGMLKSVRQDSLVERYLSTLVEAVDALGRLLLNFYWHQGEFEDRYGKSDMPELEDSIRNAFESVGDVTLYLKEKTIESPFDDGDIDLDDVAAN